MSTPDDDAWVADLLGASDPPAMPPEVAERLDRAVRAHVAAHPPLAAADRGDQPPRPAAEAGAAVPAVDPPPGEPAPSTAATGPATTPSGPVGLVPPPAPRSGTGARPVPDRRDAAEAAGDGARDATGSAAAPGASSSAGEPDFAEPAGTSLATRRRQREEQAGERRRALAARWLPVAAGVLVLGAGGAVVVGQLGGQDSAVMEAGDAGGGAETAAAPVPRALVATGTDYTPGDGEQFEAQVTELVRTASSGPPPTLAEEGAADAEGEVAEDEAGAAADAPAGDSTAAPEEAAAEDGEDLSALSSPEQAPADARAGAAASPLADTDALRECVLEVTEGGSEQAAAVDLATVDGLLSTVVVVQDASGEGYFVYVTGPDCEGLRDFYRVQP